NSAPTEARNQDADSDAAEANPFPSRAQPSDETEDDDFEEGSNKTQRKRLRKRQRTHKPAPKPTLSDLGPRVHGERSSPTKRVPSVVRAPKQAVGARRVDDVIVERLKSGAYMVHCKDATIQRKLSIQNLIGGAAVTCTIPQPTTTGVIYNIPLGAHHLERLQAVIPDATRVERLKNKTGDPTKAVKITFRTAILPKTVHLGTTVAPVVPFAAPEPQGRKTEYDRDFWESQHPKPPPLTKSYAAAARSQGQQRAAAQNSARDERPRQPAPAEQPHANIKARSHPSSGSTDHVLHDLVAETDLCLNTGHHTRIPDRHECAATAIDLTFTSPALYPTLEWCPEDESLGSDHLPITITIHANQPEAPQPPPLS
ncbi:hypothetical protein BaRGS_00040058, partial [Batillaria attramentaria]